MDMVETSFGNIATTVAGVGRPVVLLHANGHDHRDFDAIVGALSARYRTVALDWPGHGASTRPAAPADLTAGVLPDVLEQVLDQLEVVDAIIIGNSMGGYAAIKIAVQSPHRVAGLVLVNSGGLQRSTPMSRTFCRTLGTENINRWVMPRLIDRYMRAATELDRSIASRAKQHLATPDGTAACAAIWRSFNRSDYDLRAEAATISAPTLLLWGRDDPILGKKAAAAAHAALPHSELALLPTGHVPFSSAPAEFLEHALRFIESTGSGPGVVRP